MNSKVYKSCAVPLCKNTSLKIPDKVFIHVPTKKIIRDKWLKLARRKPTDIVTNSPLYFCEDHFDLPNDMENYMEYHVMGSVSQIRMKPGCMPRKFACQPDRKTRASNTIERPYIAKKRRKTIVEECLKESEEKNIVAEQSSFEEIASGSSVQQNVEEVPQLTPKVSDKSIQVYIWKKFRSKATQTKVNDDICTVDSPLAKKLKEDIFLLRKKSKEDGIKIKSLQNKIRRILRKQGIIKVNNSDSKRDFALTRRRSFNSGDESSDSTEMMRNDFETRGGLEEELIESVKLEQEDDDPLSNG